jgi:hypothetical protein
MGANISLKIKVEVIVMKKNKKKKVGDSIILGTTCHNEHEKYRVPCEKQECRYWHAGKESQNCTMISSRQGEKTLQEIGDIFGVTRMRICQIEKLIFRKLITKASIKEL